MKKLKEKTLTDLLKKFDWHNDDITEENFPRQPIRGEIKLFHFDRYISTEDAIKEMDKEGYEPANAWELLSWYGWNEKDWVVALGQEWRDPYGRRGVVYLGRYGDERYAYLLWIDDDWNDACRFAAVRKIASDLEPRDVEPLEIRILDLEKRLERVEGLFNKDLFLTPHNKEAV